MSEFNPEYIATVVFNRLRKSGFSLGVSEYIAAIDAIRGGMGTKSLDELRLILQLLWSHSLTEQFNLIWHTAIAQITKTAFEKPSEKEQKLEDILQRTQTPEIQQQQQWKELPPSQQIAPEFVPLPVRTPFFPIEIEDSTELRLNFPVNRRSLSYLWRYLRRPVADGPKDLLDVEATVQQVAQQGFFLAPVYQRREVNHAHLLLLIDQDGSMTPFHRFTRDLVETAQEDSTIETVNAYYFHNVPAAYVYEDDHLTTPVILKQVLANCDNDTSVLIVSDGGAARGYRRMERIRATTEFLVQLKQKTSLISWLNPMPRERWESSSAEVIAYLVSMEQMNDDGMSNAIDIVRGQPLSGGIASR